MTLTDWGVLVDAVFIFLLCIYLVIWIVRSDAEQKARLKRMQEDDEKFYRQADIDRQALGLRQVYRGWKYDIEEVANEEHR